MRPDRNVRREYVQAFAEIVTRIASSLSSVPKRALPIRMFVAGGADRLRTSIDIAVNIAQDAQRKASAKRQP
jgi:hypothetical protein